MCAGQLFFRKQNAEAEQLQGRDSNKRNLASASLELMAVMGGWFSVGGLPMGGLAALTACPALALSTAGFWVAAGCPPPGEPGFGTTLPAAAFDIGKGHVC
jgi:hypothetical protein